MELDPFRKPEPQYVGPPPPPRRTGMPAWAIGLIALGAVLLLGFLAVLALGSLWRTTDAAPEHLPASTGEDVVLKQVPGTGAPLKYGNTAVHDACSIVTMDKLSALGVRLSEKHGVGHEHLDADVPESAAVAQGSDEISKCVYTPANESILSVRVLQTPFNTADELRSSSARGVRAGSAPRAEDGLTVIQWQDDQFKTRNINVWSADALLDISFSTDNQARFGRLDADAFAVELEKMAKEGLSKGPTAPMQHVYNEFMGKVKDPCAAVSKAAFQKAYPGVPSEVSYVEANYPLRAEHPDVFSPKYEKFDTVTRNGTTTCARHNLVPSKEQYRELRADLSVWEGEESATQLNNEDCSPSGGRGEPVAVTPAVGNGKTCLGDQGTDWTFHFKVDNVAVTLQGAVSDNFPSQARRDSFLPAAQEMVAAGLIR